MMALAPVAAFLCVAGHFDPNAVVVGELRAGEAPLIAGASSQKSTIGILTPSLDLEYIDQLVTVHLGYSLRMSWRYTDDGVMGTWGGRGAEPVFLHVGTLAVKAVPTRRLSLSLGGSVSEGSVDYTYFTSNAATVPTSNLSQASLATVQRFFSVSTTDELQYLLTPIAKANLALLATYNRPLDQPPTAAGPVGQPAAAPAPVGGVPFILPTFTLASATPAITVRRSTVQEWKFGVTAEYQRISNVYTTTDMITFGHPLTSWSIIPRLSERLILGVDAEVTLSAGIAYSRLVGPYFKDANSFVPVVSAAYTGTSLTRPGLRLRTHAAGTVDYFLDPLLGIFGPRATAILGLTLATPHEWTSGIEASFATDLELHQINGFYPDQMVAAVSLPIRHRMSRNFIGEFGVRWSDRSPQFSAPNIGFHQRQIWIYALVTATTRPVPPWGQP